MSTEEGATIDNLIGAANWLPYTARAALTGLRKRGYVIQLERAESRVLLSIASPRRRTRLCANDADAKRPRKLPDTRTEHSAGPSAESVPERSR